jgi:endonuclease/exonuclease/phosphatase family metal-dependent hydrolase
MLISLLLSSFLTLVELNCENLFDTRHDVGKEDTEFLPDGARRWTRTKYWGKLNRIGQEILSCSDELPDLVALVEVENDSVLYDLCHRSLLRNAGYQYLMTESFDVRGVDVALLYHPVRFRPLCYEYLEVPLLRGMRPTRDILYVQGLCATGDTLHVFVVHSPSRYGGERQSRPYRQQVAGVLLQMVAQIGLRQPIVITGDFNDYADSPVLRQLCRQGLHNATANARGRYGKAQATYRYQGEWQSLDHVLLSPILYNKVDTAYINDAPFLLEEEPRYGGKRPYRTFQGYRHRQGFSDHLPLVVRFRQEP